MINHDDDDAGNVADNDVAVAQVQEEHREGAGGGERVRGTSRLQGCRGQPAPTRSTVHLSFPILGFC